MKILVTKNLLNSIRTARKKYWHEQLDFKKIYKKIHELLINDNFIKSSQPIEFEVSNEKNQSIFIKDLNKVIFICPIADFNGNAKGRNTFIAQNFVRVYLWALEKGINPEHISISINPFDLHRNVHMADYIKNSICELKTIGIKINESINKYGDFKLFSSLDDYLNRRDLLRKRNKGNSSSLIENNKVLNKVIVYGRLDGANSPNTFLICNVLNKINFEKSSLSFYDVTPINKKSEIAMVENIKKISYFNIENASEHEREMILQINSMPAVQRNIDEMLQRNQALFRANIIKKYIDVKDFDLHKCMASSYLIEQNFVGSHIYRYADIIHDFYDGKLSPEQAVHLIVSGDNGFLLAPNQDKEFEKGYIIFDLSTKKFIVNPKCKSLPQNQLEQIKNSLNSSPFQNVKFTNEFIENVKKHIDRVNSNV